MTSSEQATEPQLDPPGAGLPKLELLVSRVGFKLMMPFISRAGASRWFRNEVDRILTLAKSISVVDTTKRVLIPRLSGLEDSSRYWSVCMTLEHLVIVDSAITGGIESLVSGIVPGRAASTAAVKPSTSADAAMIDRFESVARDYLARVDALADLRTKVTYRHPWFGEMNALNWHRLAALHHRIHRKQIERIIQLMPRELSAV